MTRLDSFRIKHQRFDARHIRILMCIGNVKTKTIFFDFLGNKDWCTCAGQFRRFLREQFSISSSEFSRKFRPNRIEIGSRANPDRIEIGSRTDRERIEMLTTAKAKHGSQILVTKYFQGFVFYNCGFILTFLYYFKGQTFLNQYW